jgi:hypothetical protein
MDAPRLENRPPTGGNPAGSDPTGGSTNEPTSNPSFPESTSEPPRSYWQLQNAEDSTALIRPPAPRTPRDPVSLSSGSTEGAVAKPIPAPDDYVSPFDNRPMRPSPPASIKGDTFAAPPLPERSYEASDATSVSHRAHVPVREARLIREPVRRPRPQPLQRDTTWTAIGP